MSNWKLRCWIVSNVIHTKPHLFTAFDSIRFNSLWIHRHSFQIMDRIEKWISYMFIDISDYIRFKTPEFSRVPICKHTYVCCKQKPPKINRDNTYEFDLFGDATLYQWHYFSFSIYSWFVGRKKIHANRHLEPSLVWITLFSSTDEKELISRASIEMAHLCVYLREWVVSHVRNVLPTSMHRSVCNTTTLAVLLHWFR